MHRGALRQEGRAEPADPAGGGGEGQVAGRPPRADRAPGPHQRDPGPQDGLPQRVRQDHRRDRGGLHEDPGKLADAAERAEEGSREPGQSHRVEEPPRQGQLRAPVRAWGVGSGSTK